MFLTNIKKGKVYEEGRVFQVKWKSMYFCGIVGKNIICFICQKIISIAKEYNLRRDYESNNKGDFKILKGKLRED